MITSIKQTASFESLQFQQDVVPQVFFSASMQEKPRLFVFVSHFARSGLSPLLEVPRLFPEDLFRSDEHHDWFSEEATTLRLDDSLGPLATWFEKVRSFLDDDDKKDDDAQRGCSRNTQS
jgi:hypothetical protein